MLPICEPEAKNMEKSKMARDWKARYALYLSVGVILMATTASLVTLMLPERIYVGETESFVAQDAGQNIVNLVLAIPLLGFSLLWMRTGNEKARYIWMGTLFYFVYTYLSAVMLFAFNSLFLAYVAIFSMALYALVLVFIDMDLRSLRIDISRKVSRRTAYVLFFLVAMILLLWLPEIISLSISGGESERLVQDGQRTYVITAMDLGLLVPLGLLGGHLILKREPLGFVLAPVLLIKGMTLAAAVLSMIVFMVVAGTPPAVPEVVIFVVMFTVLLVITITYMAAFEPTKEVDQDDQGRSSTLEKQAAVESAT
jgi:hypothetical protein